MDNALEILDYWNILSLSRPNAKLTDSEVPKMGRVVTLNSMTDSPYSVQTGRQNYSAISIGVVEFETDARHYYMMIKPIEESEQSSDYEVR